MVCMSVVEGAQDPYTRQNNVICIDMNAESKALHRMNDIAIRNCKQGTVEGKAQIFVAHHMTVHFQVLHHDTVPIVGNC